MASERLARLRSVMAVLATFVIAVGTLVGVTSVVAAQAAPMTGATAYRADRDCGDFATQAAAQRFFLDHGGPQSDPHRLDADGDGIACESNPCPCYYGTGGGGGGGGDADGGTRGPKTVKQKAIITNVVDGDTVDVKLLPRGPKKRVRLLGIDTPEVFGGRECWGPQASAATKRILPRKTRVLLVSDPTQDLKDRYGRLLRYVQKGKRDVNKTLVARGHAKVYIYGGNPFKRTKAYKGAQAAAKRGHRGLWGHC